MKDGQDMSGDPGCPDTEGCVFSSMGHCGRSEWEWWKHCEKRLGEGLAQRSVEAREKAEEAE